jgi:hypothetical protein
MWGDNDILQPKQRLVGSRRLLGEDVQLSSCNRSAL